MMSGVVLGINVIVHVLVVIVTNGVAVITELLLIWGAFQVNKQTWNFENRLDEESGFF